MLNERLLRIQDVKHIVGFGKSMIYQKISDGTFPRPIKLTPKVSVWRESEIQEWIAAVIEASHNPPHPPKNTSLTQQLISLK